MRRLRPEPLLVLSVGDVNRLMGKNPERLPARPVSMVRASDTIMAPYGLKAPLFRLLMVVDV